MKKERRDFFVKTANLETRELEGKKYLIGIIPYNSRSEDMGFREILQPGCFAKTIKEARIVALYNHDASKVLGNNKAGTLSFEDTETGLICKVELPNTSFAHDAFESVRSGNVDTMSFGFSAVKDNWDNGKNERLIVEARLYEVSFCVPFPAYEKTNSVAEMRTLIEKGFNFDSLGEILIKAEYSEDDINEIRTFADSLSKIIEERKHVEPVEPLDAVAELEILEKRLNLLIAE